MGLWIRSQDKETLIKCNSFSLTIDNRIITKYKYVDGYEYYECLGTYSSKEQALKVLDLIQKELEMNLDVFQMPQDSEVR